MRFYKSRRRIRIPLGARDRPQPRADPEDSDCITTPHHHLALSLQDCWSVRFSSLMIINYCIPALQYFLFGLARFLEHFPLLDFRDVRHYEIG